MFIAIFPLLIFLIGPKIAEEQVRNDLFTASLVSVGSGLHGPDSNSTEDEAELSPEEASLVRWLNEQAVLHAVDRKVENLWSDLRNGVFLIHLIAVLNSIISLFALTFPGIEWYTSLAHLC